MAFISRIKRLFRHDGRKPTILSIEDMMSMSDEELGREFSKCGEWKHVLKKDSIENVINSIVWYRIDRRSIITYHTFGRLVHDDFLQRITPAVHRLWIDTGVVPNNHRIEYSY